MNVIRSLEICSKNRHCQFTQDECRQTLVLISSLMWKIPKENSKIVNAINWIGRWTILFVALVASLFILDTWEWNNQYYADALAAISIYFHAAFMLFKWWTK